MLIRFLPTANRAQRVRQGRGGSLEFGGRDCGATGREARGGTNRVPELSQVVSEARSVRDRVGQCRVLGTRFRTESVVTEPWTGSARRSSEPSNCSGKCVLLTRMEQSAFTCNSNQWAARLEFYFTLKTSKTLSTGSEEGRGGQYARSRSERAPARSCARLCARERELTVCN